MKGKGKGAFVALLVVAITAVAVMVGAATAAPQKPIVIGWAFDGKGAMAPFDGPALAAAQIRVKEWNAKGGVKGRKLKISTCDTQGNKPAIAKACAAKLLGQGVDVMFTTCDVDFAAPVVQESINAGKLTVAPCIGTDQMGPKRFGAKGRLAFSFGNVAQDEGSAMAEYAWSKGWKTAAARHRHRDRLLQGRRQGVQGPLHAARREDRRRGELPVARLEQPDRDRDAAELRSRPT